LTLAINGGSISLGAKLLSAYSAGLALPFLVAALGIGWVTTTLRKYNKIMHYVEIVMGVVLVIVGVLLFAGVFELLARYGYYVNFGI
jgi:cytochrome c-type biogenesis protein